MVNYILLRRLMGEVKQSYEDTHAALERDYEEMMAYECQLFIEEVEQRPAYKKMMEFYIGYLEGRNE